MPYIGKHMSIVDACEILFEILDEELDLSNVEITEKPMRKMTRREKVKIARRIMAKIPLLPVFKMRISPILYAGDLRREVCA